MTMKNANALTDAPLIIATMLGLGVALGALIERCGTRMEAGSQEPRPRWHRQSRSTRRAGVMSVATSVRPPAIRSSDPAALAKESTIRIHRHSERSCRDWSARRLVRRVAGSDLRRLIPCR